MTYFDFYPFGTESIKLKFRCDECYAPVESEEICVPDPDYSADKTSDSQTENNGYAICDSCGKEFEIDIYVTYCDGTGNIRNLPDNHYVSVIEKMEENEQYLFWKNPSTEQLKIFQNHLESVENLLGHQFDEDTQFSLLVMLYAHIVAAMELFLSSVFIREVVNSDEFTRKLIETNPEFGNRKFTLKEIYQEHEKLKVTVAMYLKELIFHDLKKIKPMYKSVLNFDFEDITWLFKAVLTRHDCAHRAGYDKDGSKIQITVVEVRKLMEKCKTLAERIDSHVIESQSETINEFIL